MYSLRAEDEKQWNFLSANENINITVIIISFRFIKLILRHILLLLIIPTKSKKSWHSYSFKKSLICKFSFQFYFTAFSMDNGYDFCICIYNKHYKFLYEWMRRNQSWKDIINFLFNFSFSKWCFPIL